jgi:hypothetical protein
MRSPRDSRANWVSSAAVSRGSSGSKWGVEQLRDPFPGLVDRGRDDVTGRLVGDLEDELPEVGLPDLRPPGFEVLVDLDLLGGHRLALDHRLCVAVVDDLGDVSVGVRGVLGEVHRSAVGLDALSDLLDQFGKPLDGVRLDRPRSVF